MEEVPAFAWQAAKAAQVAQASGEGRWGLARQLELEHCCYQAKEREQSCPIDLLNQLVRQQQHWGLLCLGQTRSGE